MDPKRHPHTSNETSEPGCGEVNGGRSDWEVREYQEVNSILH